MARLRSLATSLLPMALCGAASSALVTPPPVDLPQADLWFTVAPDGLGGSAMQSIQPVTFDQWTITLTNASASAWAGFEIRFAATGGGELLNFVTHFEPRFIAGAWNGGVALIDETFAFAHFDAAAQGLSPLAPGQSVQLQVTVFNLTNDPQLYQLDLRALAVPTPAVLAPCALLVLARRRRRGQ